MVKTPPSVLDEAKKYSAMECIMQSMIYGIRHAEHDLQIESCDAAFGAG